METRRLAWSPPHATHPELPLEETILERPLETRGATHFFQPIHYEANYRYPLLVWLHGDGDDESQLRRVMPQISLRNYVAVSVAGTRRAPWSRHASSAPGAPFTHRSGLVWGQSGDDVSLAVDSVWEAVEHARCRANVHPDRVFVAGLQGGGTMALRIALAHPERFAGAISIDGALPRGGCPFARVKRARSLPILLSAFRRSTSYQADRICQDLRLLTTAGMHVALRQYPETSGIPSQVWRDLDRWMMGAVTGTPSSPAANR